MLDAFETLKTYRTFLESCISKKVLKGPMVKDRRETPWKLNHELKS